ncbi:MAG: glycosyltransferase [Terrimicrobiaceae bacterium]|nr:glycosyltransferase [Terrimicrobiaceae bacterium]
MGYLAPHYVLYKTFPYFCLPNARRILWMYDAWENEFGRIEALIRNHRINLAFLSSSQAVEHFNHLKLDRFAAHWIPEGITVSNYRWKPYGDRGIDVIQMGRKWDAYHERIKPFCESRGLTYLYEKVKGEIIFPRQEAFLDGLASSKISICVPSSITHPARSGRIETMTSRYLQSMASKCLVLGVLPEEMKQLFEHNPIIEIDRSDPCGQLRAILADFESYTDLIERNYAYVTAHHQWTNRLEQMMQQMRNCGEAVGARH